MYVGYGRPISDFESNGYYFVLMLRAELDNIVYLAYHVMLHGQINNFPRFIL